MVYLVSGKKNEGKTTRLRDLLESKENAFGFIAEKVYDCGRVTTYNLVDIRTGDKCTIARLASLPLPEDWADTVGHGPFRFSLPGFGWAMQLFRNALEEGARVFGVDELGKLELEGKGHSELIKEALKSDLDLYISVREMNIEQAVRVFGIGEHQIIKVT